MIHHPNHHELDACLTACSPGDTVRLAEGVYETAGNWAAGRDRAWCQLRPGVRIIGAGIGRSVVRLAQDATRTADGVERPDRDLNVLWGAGGNIVEDVSIDGAENERPGWHVAGLRFHGTFELRRVEIVGLRGSWKTNTPAGAVEVFAVSSVGDTGGSLMEDVTVNDCAHSAYVSGLFGGSTTGVSRASSAVRCSVDLGDDNQFGFSANRHWTFSSCESRGGRYGFYNDTGPTLAVRILNCDLNASWAGVGLIAKDGAGVRREVRVVGCMIDAPRGVEVWDRTGRGVSAEVALLGCDIHSQWTATADNPSATIVVRDCTVCPGLALYRSRASQPFVVVGNLLADGREAQPQETLA